MTTNETGTERSGWASTRSLLAAGIGLAVVGALAVSFLFVLGILDPAKATPTPQQQASIVTATPTASLPLTATSSPTPTPELGTSNLYVEYIIDASDSMTGTLADGSVKLAVAKDLLKEHIASFRPETNIGLRAYGHRVRFQHEAESCQDIELIAAPRAGQLETIAAWLGDFQALGMTPLAASLQQAFGDFVFDPARINSVVVLSDGFETCGGDPCKLVETLKARGINFTVHVIGLNVDSAARDQLTCVARGGGGTYQDARTRQDIVGALSSVRTSVSQGEVVVPHGIDTPTPAPPLATVIPGFKTYTNDDVGFALDYPSHWYEEMIGSVFSVRSYEAPQGGGSEFFAEGETKVTVAVGTAEAPTLEEADQRRTAELSRYGETESVLWQESLSLADGTSARIQLVSNSRWGDSYHLRTLIGSALVDVRTMGDINPPDTVLSIFRSFRLTPAAGPAVIQPISPAEASAGRILFLSNRDRPNDTVYQDGTKHELYVMDADGSNQRRLSMELSMHGERLSVSPDGTRILMDDYSQVSGLSYVTFADPDRRVILTTGHATSPRWSPDGNRIAYCTGFKSDDEQVIVMNADGSGATRLTTGSNRHLFVDWSPDGHRLVFMRDYQLYTMNADGSEQRPLLTGFARNLAWSPDGSMIAFEGGRWLEDREGNGGDIWVVSSDGSNPRNLTNSPNSYEAGPAWSPSSTALVFSSQGREGAPGAPKSKAQIVKMTLSNGRVDQLTTVGDNRAPTWIQ